METEKSKPERAGTTYPRVLEGPVSLQELAEINKSFEAIKIAVDIVTERVAIGGDYHQVPLELLRRTGSLVGNVWGVSINILGNDVRIQYKSFINKTDIPRNSKQDNVGLVDWEGVITGPELKENIKKIIKKFLAEEIIISN